RHSFGWALVSEFLVLGALSSKAAWLVIGFVIAETMLPFLDLRIRQRSTRVFAMHMAAFAVLLVLGQGLLDSSSDKTSELCGVVALSVAVAIRSGALPAHCWLPDLFEHAGFGSALLFVTPLIGAYTMVRLVLPIAPETVLHYVGLGLLVTALYA